MKNSLKENQLSQGQIVDVSKGLIIIYLILEYIRPQYFVPALGIIRPSLILGVLIAIVWISRHGSKISLQDELLRYYAFILVFVWLWVPFATNNYHAFNASLNLTVFFVAVTVPLGLILQDRTRRHKFVKFWIGLHVYLALFALTHAGRGPGSFLGDENDVALALCMGLPYPFFFAQLKSNNGALRATYVVVTLVILLGAVWTNSRGGFIGLVSVGAYMLWLSKNRIRNFLVVVLLTVCVYFVTPDSYIAEIQSMSDTEDSTRGQRFHQWRLGWEMFLDNPILGVGGDQYPWRNDFYQMNLDTNVPAADRLYGGRVAHSLYFTVLPEFGLVGTVPWLLILVGMLRRLKLFERGRLSRSDDALDEKDLMFAKALRASLIGYLSAGTFLSVHYYPHFWYAIGMVIGLCGFSALPKGEAAVPTNGSDKRMKVR